MRVVAAVGAAIALAAAALPGAAPAGPPTLFAIVEAAAQRQLVRVDARTLLPVGDPLPLGVVSGQFVRSPDGTQLAVGAGSGIVFIDAARMQRVRELSLKPDPNVFIIGWPRDGLLFAQGCCLGADYLRIVDPDKPESSTRVRLTFDSNGTATLSDAVAYLASPKGEIGSAHVTVVGQQLYTSFGPLTRIPVGTHWHKVRGVQVAERRQPGFTLDRERRIAYVVASSALAAEVDLRTGAIAYHTIRSASARRLARREKVFNGTIRTARWLGNGKVAVAGVREIAARHTTTPTGVALLDTSTWRMQMLDPKAGGFVTDGTWILALEPRRVEAFTSDGAHRFRFQAGNGIAYAQVFGGTAYIWKGNAVTVVDLDAGAEVATLQRPQLFLVGPG